MDFSNNVNQMQDNFETTAMGSGNTHIQICNASDLAKSLSTFVLIAMDNNNLNTSCSSCCNYLTILYTF